jgi:hypothetical protein
LNQCLQPGIIEKRALEQSKHRKLRTSAEKHIGEGSLNIVFDQASDEAILKSRSEFEVNGKRDMDAALAESLDAFENKIQQEEKQVI